MKKPNINKVLLKLNLFITLLIIFANIIAFISMDSGKDNYIFVNLHLNAVIFFIYLLLFNDKVKNNLADLKKEALYINYPLNIGIFIGLLFVILIFSAICLIIVNKDAANATFIFTFFMTTISMLFPSIVLGVFIYFMVPAFIIPSIKSKNKYNLHKKTIIALFILFLIYSFSTLYKEVTRITNIQNQDKYKSAKLTINYSTEFLKLHNISPYAKKKMSKDKIEVPFFYTEEAVPLEEYYEAENFCASMDAKVPNYLEIYHIIFNKFETFGEKYYWTSDRDGKYPLVLHYKNMSYEIVRKPKKIIPSVYCIANDGSNHGFKNKLFFYRNIKKERSANIEEMINKPFDLEGLQRYIGIDTNNSTSYSIPQQQEQINQEKKHVSFDVKEVTADTFKELLRKGYNYNPSITINQQYETNPGKLNSVVQHQTNNIRLCYYPFTEYTNMTMTQESEIWKQSFCSPAFDLISQTPILKTRFDKEAYCMANGGRVPNIPELNGILKTLGVNPIGKKYWINARINDYNTNTQKPVYAQYNDTRFMQLKTLNPGENENAYVYCIKKPQYQSKVIANYKSRFKGLEGLYFAKEKCPSCQYYEVPDTILQH